jgi:hypothetical protein
MDHSFIAAADRKKNTEARGVFIRPRTNFISSQMKSFVSVRKVNSSSRPVRFVSDHHFGSVAKEHTEARDFAADYPSIRRWFWLMPRLLLGLFASARDHHLALTASIALYSAPALSSTNKILSA